MFKNYLTVALRNLKRNKIFSLINIAGLAIGISASLVIYPDRSTVTGIGMILIALFILSIRTIKSAIENPVKSLRTE